MKPHARVVLLFSAATAFALHGLTLHAVEAKERPESPRFDRLDADGDGKVSREEYLGSVRDKKHWWQRGERKANVGQNTPTPTLFETLDRDRNGYLTQNELDAGHDLHGERGDSNGEEGGSATTRSEPAPESKTPPRK
jgi:hypothetical protein